MGMLRAEAKEWTPPPAAAAAADEVEIKQDNNVQDGDKEVEDFSSEWWAKVESGDPAFTQRWMKQWLLGEEEGDLAGVAQTAAADADPDAELTAEEAEELLALDDLPTLLGPSSAGGGGGLLLQPGAQDTDRAKELRTLLLRSSRRSSSGGILNGDRNSHSPTSPRNNNNGRGVRRPGLACRVHQPRLRSQH